MPASRRDDLIDAATRAFYRSGFHGTGVHAVLQAAGVSRMTLYNHFRSKDDLIVAALRRRDEVFRHRMLKFIDHRANDPVDRIMGVFDFHEQWFESDDFYGCMFINVSAEYEDSDSAIRRAAAEHKHAVVRYLQDQCGQARLKDASVLAEQLNMLLDGAIVGAQVLGRTGARNTPMGTFAQRARQAAGLLIDAARP